MFVRQVHGESQFDAKQDVIKAWNGSNMIINISLHSVPKTARSMTTTVNPTLQAVHLNIPLQQRLVADALSEVVPWKRKRLHHV